MQTLKISVFGLLLIINLKNSLGIPSTDDGQLVDVWCDEETLNSISTQLKELNKKITQIDEKISKSDSPPAPSVKEVIENTVRDYQMQLALERVTQSIKALQDNQHRLEQQIIQTNQTIHAQLTRQIIESEKSRNNQKIPQIISESGVHEGTAESASTEVIAKITELQKSQTTAAEHIKRSISNEHEQLWKRLKTQIESSFNSLLPQVQVVHDFETTIKQAAPQFVELASKTVKETIKSNLPNMVCDLTKAELQTELHDLKDEMHSFNRTISQLFEPTFSNCINAIETEGVNGVYRLHTPQARYKPFDAYCMADPNNDTAWTIIQRRQDGSVDFYRDWDAYKRGFGNPSGEYWLGLEKIYAMTAQEPHELWIQLTDQEGETRHARYTKFEIGTVKEAYFLKSVGTYSGNAGDSLGFASTSRKFTTKDVDNDDDKTRNCAVRFRGAWWYNTCNWSDLNAQYNSTVNGQGINWYKWHGYEYSLKYAHLAIRPIK